MANITPPDTAPDALLLTPPQAARQLSVSVRTLYSLFTAGKIKPLKIGRSTRVSSADLAAFVASLQAEQGGAA